MIFIAIVSGIGSIIANTGSNVVEVIFWLLRIAMIVGGYLLIKKANQKKAQLTTEKKPIEWKRIIRGFVAYGLGIGLGTFLVWALWLRNRETPNMWPEGMVKDQIGRSKMETNPINDCYLKCFALNDSILKKELKKGDVIFGISKTRRKPAPVYAIDISSVKGEKMRWWIESKDSTYNIFKMEDLPGTTSNHICDCQPVSF